MDQIESYFSKNNKLLESIDSKLTTSLNGADISKKLDNLSNDIVKIKIDTEVLKKQNVDLRDLKYKVEKIQNLSNKNSIVAGIAVSSLIGVIVEFFTR